MAHSEKFEETDRHNYWNWMS